MNSRIMQLPIVQFALLSLYQHIYRWVTPLLCPPQDLSKDYLYLFQRAQIQQIGGRDARSTVRLGLESMLTRGVQEAFSKDGKKGKRAFSKTLHYKCLLGEINCYNIR